MFAAPLFLLGLAAAAIPLVLHLRRARHVRRITFSHTRFFDEAFIRSARRARIQDRLLMLLRMALICLFATALARPLLSVPGLGGLTGDRRTVAVILDDSASMSVVTERGVLLDRARDAALAALRDLSTTRGDRATLVLAGDRASGAQVLFDPPTTDLDGVRQAIRGTTPTGLATDLDAAVAAGRAALGQASGRRDIVVVSDLQASAFAPGAFEKADPSIGVCFVSVRPTETEGAGNVSIDAIRFGAARPMRAIPYTFRILITNHGTAPVQRAVQFVIGDEILARREETIEPGRSAIVRFVHRFAEPGWFAGRVGFDPAGQDGRDVQPADDERHFVVHVGAPLEVLAINGAPSRIPRHDELFFLRAALAAGEDGVGRPIVDQIAPTELTTELTTERLEKRPVVVLANVADLEPAQVALLERHVDDGGGLLIALGDRADAERYNQWVGDHRLHGGLLPARLGGRVAVESFVASIDSEHPVMAPFADGRLGYLSSVRVRERFDLVLRQGHDPEGVMMRDSDGRPLLVERRFGKGRVLLFATTVDRDWSDFPLQPAFVPTVYRLLTYLAGSGAGRADFAHTGQIVTLATSIHGAAAHRVVCPDGTVLFPEPPSDPSQRGMVVSTTEISGVYRVERVDAAGGSLVQLFCTNTPRRESRLDDADEATLREHVGDSNLVFIDDGTDIGAAMQTARTGRGLWEQLLIVALLVCLIEPWWANRLTARRGNAPKVATQAQSDSREAA